MVSLVPGLWMVLRLCMAGLVLCYVVSEVGAWIAGAVCLGSLLIYTCITKLSVTDRPIAALLVFP